MDEASRLTKAELAEAEAEGLIPDVVTRHAVWDGVDYECVADLMEEHGWMRAAELFRIMSYKRLPGVR